MKVSVCWIYYIVSFYTIFIPLRFLCVFRSSVFSKQTQNMLFFNAKIYFFKKSNSKCINKHIKLILNTFKHKLTFFMIWWQQAHFFMVFQFFWALAYITLEVILCTINAYSCAFCASICLVVSFYSNFWYVHIRHNCLMIYKIFEFFQKFSNFGKIEKKKFAPRIEFMLVVYKKMLQKFSFISVLLIFNEILIYSMK